MEREVQEWLESLSKEDILEVIKYGLREIKHPHGVTAEEFFYYIIKEY